MSEMLPGRHFINAGPFSRNQFFAALVVVGFANGIGEKLASQLEGQGLVLAVFDTFGISVIVWSAAVIAIVMLLRAEPQPIGAVDFAVAALTSVAFLVPVPSLSWLAISGLAVYLSISRQSSRAFARAGAVLLAMTIPMFWARLLLAATSNIVLEVDAALVSQIVGTDSAANTVPLADGSGLLFFEPACSSLSNVSIAILCAVLFVKVYDLSWSAGTIFIGVLACAAAIVINVVRMGLIGLYPDYYWLIHGPIGASFAGWLSLAAILGICFGGMRPNAPAPV
ncbi:hypothetical protein [Pseudaminobacter sp. NGMCC 1.201702]|uniref:hypothetical protein n=1 Tax=Pseudaminobacter sp. NGMCC 1.201702 TaxID=3391825 RepID=UPI0039EFB8A5